MIVGFVLINADLLRKDKICSELLGTSEVVEVNCIFGEYDLIVKLEVDSFDSLAKVVADKIKIIEGILDTKTLTGTMLF